MSMFFPLAFLLPFALLKPTPQEVEQKASTYAALEASSLVLLREHQQAASEETPAQRLMVSMRGRIDPEALSYALEARECAIRAGLVQPKNGRLTLIDYTLPSNEKRLWILDLDSGQMVFEDYVAHGSGSGGVTAERFSNIPNSHMSSLGLIEPMFEFQASSGRALRLKGLEPGINDRVYDREIIVHPSSYIGNGRTGRSQGCQAVNHDTIDVVVDGMKGGLLYAFHKEESVELASRLIGCGAVLKATDLACKAPTPVSPFAPAQALAWHATLPARPAPTYLATR